MNLGQNKGKNFKRIPELTPEGSVIPNLNPVRGINPIPSQAPELPPEDGVIPTNTISLLIIG